MPPEARDASVGYAKVHLNIPMTRKAGHAVYAIARSGQPVRYAQAIAMRDCRFVINARLRVAFEAKPTRRTVHALIAGTITGYDPVPDATATTVRCNPFRYRTFVGDDEAHVVSASTVCLFPDKRIEARGLRYDHATATNWSGPV